MLIYRRAFEFSCMSLNQFAITDYSPDEGRLMEQLADSPGITEVGTSGLLTLKLDEEIYPLDFLSFGSDGRLMLSETKSLPPNVAINAHLLPELTRQNLLIAEINSGLRKTFFVSYWINNKRHDFFYIFVGNRLFTCNFEAYHKYVLGAFQSLARERSELGMEMLGYYAMIVSKFASLLLETEHESNATTTDATQPTPSPIEQALLIERGALQSIQQGKILLIGPKVHASVSKLFTKSEEAKEKTRQLLTTFHWAWITPNESITLPRVSVERRIVIGSSPLEMAKGSQTSLTDILMLTNIETCPVHCVITISGETLVDVMVDGDKTHNVRARIVSHDEETGTTLLSASSDSPQLNMNIVVTVKEAVYTIQIQPVRES